jgi:hypothetical protein
MGKKVTSKNDPAFVSSLNDFDSKELNPNLIP